MLPPNQTPRLTLGQRIEYLRAKIMGRNRGNAVVAVCNAVLNIKTVAGKTWRWVISPDGGLILERGPTDGGSGAGNVRARGEYITGETYMEGDLVYVRGTINAGAYIANKDNPVGDPWDSIDWDQYANNAGAMGVWQ